ncbi:MAG: hypothetical protein K2Z81_07250 [Cyanobacteria bacterium]|nr:hypothetical protein [Cyanobacteriota bacterium]
MMIPSFDLLEYQHMARDSKSQKKLFELWDFVCKQYERGKIGRYEMDEMKDVVWSSMRSLSSIKSMIDEPLST